MPHRLDTPSQPCPLSLPLFSCCCCCGHPIPCFVLSTMTRIARKLIEFLYHKFSRISGQAFCRFNCCHHQHSAVKFLSSTREPTKCEGLLYYSISYPLPFLLSWRAFQFVSYLTHFCHPACVFAFWLRFASNLQGGGGARKRGRAVR